MENVTAHIQRICKEAGLGSMAEVLVFITDRDNVADSTLLAMTETDITAFYDICIGPAVDQIEDILIERED